MPYVSSSIAHIHDVASLKTPQSATANLSESYTISDSLSRQYSALRSISETSLTSTLFTHGTSNTSFSFVSGNIYGHKYTPAPNHKVMSVTFQLDKLSSLDSGIMYCRIYDNPTGSGSPVVLETSTNFLDISTQNGVFNFTFLFAGTGIYNNQLISVGLDSDEYIRGSIPDPLLLVPLKGTDSGNSVLFTKFNSTWHDLNTSYDGCLEIIEQISLPGISISDSLSSTINYFRNITESYTFSDALTSIISIKRAILETSYNIIDSLDAVVNRAVKVVTGGGAYTPIPKRRVQGIQADKFNNITIKVYIKDKKINPFVLYRGLTNNIETGVKLRVTSISDISNLISMASKLSSKLESLPNIKLPTSIVNFTDTMVKSILKTLNLDDLVIKTMDEQRKLDFVTLKTKTENKSEKDINMASILDNIDDINDTEKIE